MSTILLMIGLVYFGKVLFKKLDSRLIELTAVKILIKTSYVLLPVSVVSMMVVSINSDGSFGAGLAAGLIFWIGLFLSLILLALSGLWFAVSKILKLKKNDN